MFCNNSMSQDTFAAGFEAGWEQTMRDNMQIRIAPLCPVPPVNSDGSYNSGFAYGAALAAKELGK